MGAVVAGSVWYRSCYGSTGVTVKRVTNSDMYILVCGSKPLQLQSTRTSRTLTHTTFDMAIVALLAVGVAAKLLYSSMPSISEYMNSMSTLDTPHVSDADLQQAAVNHRRGRPPTVPVRFRTRPTRHLPPIRENPYRWSSAINPEATLPAGYVAELERRRAKAFARKQCDSSKRWLSIAAFVAPRQPAARLAFNTPQILPYQRIAVPECPSTSTAFDNIAR